MARLALIADADQRFDAVEDATAQAFRARPCATIRQVAHRP